MPKENKKIVTRVDDAFYNTCVDKLNDAILHDVFKEDTELEKILLKDIFIVLGYYLQWLGRSIAAKFSPELVENAQDFDNKILTLVGEIEELAMNEEFGTTVTAMGGLLEIAGKEMPGTQPEESEQDEDLEDEVTNEDG